MDPRTGRPRGYPDFYDDLFDALDQHLKRGADPELMAAALGTKLADILARCIHYSHMPRAKAEAWIKHQQAMLHKVTWSMVQELKAQPRGQD
jgi:hypothetical protein